MKDEINERDFVGRNLDDYGDFLNVSDIMKILKVSYPTALGLLTLTGEKGKIKAFRIKSVWRIRKEDFREFIDYKVDYYKNIKVKKGKGKK